MVDAIGTVQLQSASSRSAPRSEAVVVSVGTVQKEAAPLGFVSSSIRVDNLQNVAILEYRSETGEVVQQYPTQAQIDAFKSAERLQVEHQHVAASQDAAPQTEHHEVGGKSSPPRVAVKAPAPHEAAHVSVTPAKGSGESAHGTHSVVA